MCILFPFSIEELNETGGRVPRPDEKAGPADVKKTGDSVKLFFSRDQAARCWLLLWLLLSQPLFLLLLSALMLSLLLLLLALAVFLVVVVDVTGQLEGEARGEPEVAQT